MFCPQDRLTACPTFKMSFEYKQFYRRKLPHIHSPGAILFVTFRLAGSIRKTLIDQWKLEKQLIESELKKIDGLR